MGNSMGCPLGVENGAWVENERVENEWVENEQVENDRVENGGLRMDQVENGGLRMALKITHGQPV